MHSSFSYSNTSETNTANVCGEIQRHCWLNQLKNEKPKKRVPRDIRRSLFPRLFSVMHHWWHWNVCSVRAAEALLLQTVFYQRDVAQPCVFCITVFNTHVLSASLSLSLCLHSCSLSWAWAWRIMTTYSKLCWLEMLEWAKPVSSDASLRCVCVWNHFQH